MVAGLSRAVQVAVSEGMSCARLEDRTVSCWGGFLTSAKMPDECGGGLRIYPCARRPIAIPGLRDVKHVALARGKGCALHFDGTVTCWGRYDYAEGSPVPKPLAIGRASAVVLDDERTCVLLADGRAACVGANYNGQLGDGTRENRTTPVIALITDVVELVLGRLHTCARLRSNTVACWGHNGSDELGHTTNLIDGPVPGPVPNLPAVRKVVARHSRTCAIAGDGTVWCWGDHLLGTFRAADAFGDVPALKVPNLDHVSDLAMDTFHACALIDDGTLRCWGSDRFGQLGDGRITESGPPAPVAW